MQKLYIAFILGFTDLKTGAWKRDAGSTALHDLHLIATQAIKLVCIRKIQLHHMSRHRRKHHLIALWQNMATKLIDWIILGLSFSLQNKAVEKSEQHVTVLGIRYLTPLSLQMAFLQCWEYASKERADSLKKLDIVFKQTVEKEVIPVFTDTPISEKWFWTGRDLCVTRNTLPLTHCASPSSSSPP